MLRTIPIATQMLSLGDVLEFWVGGLNFTLFLCNRPFFFFSRAKSFGLKAARINAACPEIQWSKKQKSHCVISGNVAVNVQLLWTEAKMFDSGL